MMHGHRESGFSIIELMTTVALLSAVALMATPSFNTIQKNNRIYTQSNDFYLALMRARSEALSRAQRVTVCASSTGTSCTGAWTDGWLVYTENSDPQDITIDSADGDEILEVQSALTGNNTLVGNTDVASYISYVGTGFTAKVESGYPAQSGTLVLCDDRGMTSGRAIKVNAGGRPRVFSASDAGFTSCIDSTPP